MSMTFEDIKLRLKQLDELTLLEIFNLSSEELVDLLDDLIVDRYETLEALLDDDETSD